MRRVLTLCLVAALPAAAAFAAGEDAKQELIELDQKWGESTDAGVVGSILADGLIALDGSGVATKADQLKELTAEDAPTGPYEADEYQVTFLDDDTAIMVHRSLSPDPHRSLHVWVKKEGRWQVVATVSTPIDD